ncbi:MAG: helix-turn-helix domain-containing protein [Candidatus Limnocylindrales bacterium]
MARVSKTRPRVDDSPLARQIGERLRRTRLAAGLTQQQLAEGRYTKAYVSALENGLSRPSMAALNFFSNRLAIPASKLINDEPAAWARLEADLALASGRWDDAIAAYRDLLESTVTREARAELMSGLAEALIREGKGREATPFAAEAARIFHAANREAEAALSEYWLAAAHYLQENGAESKALLQSLLSRVRAGLRVEPDFELRLVMALSSNESREDNHVAALAYLEEVRGLADSLDDRRRANYLHDLAYSYRETGDFEAAVRSGIASLELFRRVEADRDTANLENDLALSYLALGNTVKATELATSSRDRLESLGDDWLLSHVLDTQARIALASGAGERAAAAAQEALVVAERASNLKASVDALLTLARAKASLGENAAALEANGRAGELARQLGNASLTRKALREWADALAAAGQHEQAFAVMREALAAS